MAFRTDFQTKSEDWSPCRNAIKDKLPSSVETKRVKSMLCRNRALPNSAHISLCFCSTSGGTGQHGMDSPAWLTAKGKPQQGQSFGGIERTYRQRRNDPYQKCDKSKLLRLERLICRYNHLCYMNELAVGITSEFLHSTKSGRFVQPCHFHGNAFSTFN